MSERVTNYDATHLKINALLSLTISREKKTITYKIAILRKENLIFTNATSALYLQKIFKEKMIKPKAEKGCVYPVFFLLKIRELRSKRTYFSTHILFDLTSLLSRFSAYHKFYKTKKLRLVIGKFHFSNIRNWIILTIF